MPTIKRTVDVAFVKSVQNPVVKKPRVNSKGVGPNAATPSDMVGTKKSAGPAKRAAAHASPLAPSSAQTNNTTSWRGSSRLPAQTPAHLGPDVDVSPIFEKLKDFGLDDSDLADAIKHTEPNKLHEALKENVGDLVKLGFRLQDISRIVSGRGGTSRLASLKMVSPGLLEEGYRRRDLVEVAKFFNKFPALETLRDLGPALLKRGFKQSHLIAAVCWERGSENIQALFEHGPALSALRYEVDELVAAAGFRGAAAALKALAEHGQSLMKQGYKREETLEIVLGRGAGGTLQVLDAVTPALLQYGLMKSQLVTIARGSYGKDKLELISNHLPKLEKNGVKTGMLVNHASPNRNLKSFKVWLQKITASLEGA